MSEFVAKMNRRIALRIVHERQTRPTAPRLVQDSGTNADQHRHNARIDHATASAAPTAIL
jgi:hypothetical protein